VSNSRCGPEYKGFYAAKNNNRKILSILEFDKFCSNRKYAKNYYFSQKDFRLKNTQKNHETHGSTAEKHIAKSYTFLQRFVMIGA